MNGKQAKLLRKYSKLNGFPKKMVIVEFKKMSHSLKGKLTTAIKKFLHKGGDK